MKRALLVGINHYPQKEDRLRGCVHDVDRMKAALIKVQGFEESSIRTLTDAAATRAEIERELVWLATGTSADDVCVFFYSGHGSSTPDRNGDEPDGRDECLVPVDHEQAGKLIDDDLADHYRRFAQGCNLTLVMDCCHSGTNQKHHQKPDVAYRFLHPRREEELAILAARRRYQADRDAFMREALAQYQKSDVDELRQLVEQMIGKFGSARGKIGNVANREHNVLLAGCEARQKSAEAVLAGSYQGALTHFLLEAMEASGPLVPATDIVRSASEMLYRAGFPQIPQLEGKDEHKARPLFSPLV